MARPSLCLVLVLLASLLLVASAHADQLPEVQLTETNPHSSEEAPVNWTTPRIKGEEAGEGEINALRSTGHIALARTAATGVSSEVTLYTDPACLADIATGDLGELIGEGIEVEVPANSATTFYAIQRDPTLTEAPSDCSKFGLTYWASSTGVTPGEAAPPGGGPGGGDGGLDAGTSSSGPPAPPHLRVLPGGRANDNVPRIAGSAPGASTVRVFSGSACAGAPVASGSAEVFAAGLPVHVDDNSVNTFTAVAAAGAKASGCSDPVTYAEDSLAPRTRITMGPGVKTRRRKAVFRFTDTTEDPPGTSFFCKVDNRKWKSCHSPFRLRHLRVRRHVLQVRAVDLAGNAENRPAQRRFKVVRGL